MKIKTQLTLASVIAAGLLASGCSQHAAVQQAVPAMEAAPVVDVVPQQTQPAVKTVVDCSSCHKPAPRPQPRPRGNMHGHPAVPGCTDAVQHNHPHPQGGRHNHKYSCKKTMKAAPRPAPRANPNMHSHPAIPNCTKSVRHVHPNGSRAHQHKYSCQRPVYRPAPAPRPVYRPAPVPRPVYQQPVPVMPKVKAKGTYRGPIKIDGMMKQYQQ